MNFTAPKRLSSIIAIGFLVVLVSILSWVVVRRQRVEDRVYKIGFDSQPPQHYVGEDGKPTGLAVELVG